MECSYEPARADHRSSEGEGDSQELDRQRHQVHSARQRDDRRSTARWRPEFAVADTGIGVPQDAQAAIFEPFQQANGSIVNSYGGVGLGLYIVRRLSELLGGRVSMHSEEGKGSTFRVWIPLERQVHEAEVGLNS